VPDGHIALASRTYTGFAILRSNIKSGSEADVAKAVAYGKRIKFYPLSQATNSPETAFVDAIDDLFDSTIPYDLRFFEALDRFVQREPWIERDRVMIDALKTDKEGKPFDGGGTATVYDRATHALIREMRSSACSSLTPGLAKNADGSVDIYFGPKAPVEKESNWVPTKGGGGFEVMFRFYGPEKPLFDKTWKLPDIANAS